ncbi:MAG: MSMEG_1061 family FMN-dependent PPOX-type flavoprotein [Myxococcota bacterium]
MRARFAGFQDIIEDFDQVRAIIRKPIPAIEHKILDHLDPICRDFIAASPFVVLASRSPDGWLDLSPKGDPAGFVRVLDDHRLAIPDRPGNRRVDTFHNLLTNPELGLIFLVPGKGETLRVSGEARLVRDEALRQSMAVKGRVPEFAIVVYVERAFMHCPKCVMRSGLWKPERWGDASSVADIGTAMIAHAEIDQTPEQWFETIKKDGGLDMY